MHLAHSVLDWHVILVSQLWSLQPWSCNLRWSMLVQNKLYLPLYRGLVPWMSGEIWLGVAVAHELAIPRKVLGWRLGLCSVQSCMVMCFTR